MKVALLIVLVAGVQTLMAECPPTSSVDVMFNEDTFNCARKWGGPGDPQPIQGCNDCGGQEGYADLFDGLSRADLYAGSLIVMPGCTFYGFSEDDYQGDVDEKSAGLYSDVEAFSPTGGAYPGCADYYKSAKCR